MADTPNSEVRPAPIEAAINKPAKWVAVVTLLTQAVMVALVLAVACRYPGTTTWVLSAVYCAISGALGYHQIRRAFLYSRMPSRLEHGDPKLSVFKAMMSMSGSVVFIISIALSTHILGHSRSFWEDYLVPIVLLVRPWLDYLQDRLPLPPPRTRGGEKIWDSMKPVHSEHWGERGAS